MHFDDEFILMIVHLDFDALTSKFLSIFNLFFKYQLALTGLNVDLDVDI